MGSIRRSVELASALLLLAGGWICAHSLTDDFLVSFSAKSLVTITDPNPTKSGRKLLEVDEFYDGPRGLSRMVVRELSGHRKDVFVRTRQGSSVFVSLDYSPDGDIEACKASFIQRREAELISDGGGYFALFRGIIDQVRTQLKDDRRSMETPIGPSALLYMYANELRAKSAELQAQTAKGSAGYQQHLRHRLIVDLSEQLEFRLSDSSRLSFGLSGWPIGRSPKLTQLAPFVSYTNAKHPTLARLSVDFLAIDELARGGDPFRLPAGLDCPTPDGRPLIDDQLDPPQPTSSTLAYWLRRLGGHLADQSSDVPNRVSLRLHADTLAAEGVHMSLDVRGQRRLMRFEHLREADQRQTVNVVDLRQWLIYHLPNMDDPENNNVCTVLTNEVFATERARTLQWTSQTGDIWGALLGDPNAILFAGIGRDPTGDASAIELQLLYDAPADLPIYLTLLLGWRQFTSVTRSVFDMDSSRSLLIVRLWLDASQCGDLYDPKAVCNHPAPMAFQVDRVHRRTRRTIRSERVYLTDVAWDSITERLADGTSNKQPLAELADCPALDRLHLELEVSWKSPQTDSPSGGCADRLPALDDLVLEQLTTELANVLDDLAIVKFERQDFPGTRMAKYSLRLAEHPKEVVKFGLLHTAMDTNLSTKLPTPIGRLESPTTLTLFDCLTWASKFGVDRAILHSAKECRVYEKVETFNKLDDEPVAADDDALDKGTVYASMLRRMGNTLSIDAFVKDQLEQVNARILEDNKKGDRQACVADGLTASSVQFGALVRVDSGREDYKESPVVSVRGYKFSELAASIDDEVHLRAQMEVATYTQCQDLCKTNDNCSSFAFCSYPDFGHQYCQLSDIVTLEDSKDSLVFHRNTVRDAACEIQAKDFLADFERQQETAEMLSKEQKDAWRLADVKGEQQCARMCRSVGDSSCLRFLICDQSSALCFLPKSLEVSAITQFDVRDNISSCSVYQRKPSSLYTKVMSSGDSGFNWSELVLESNLLNTDRDRCAELCTLDSECQSFDSCLIITSSAPVKDNESGKFTQLRCSLIAGSLFDSDPARKLVGQTDSRDPRTKTAAPGDPKKGPDTRELQLDGVYCDHYELLAVQRQLTAAQVNQIAGRDPLGAQGSHPSSPHDGSLVRSLFYAALVGLVLGLCVDLAVSRLQIRKLIGRPRQPTL